MQVKLTGIWDPHLKVGLSPKPVGSGSTTLNGTTGHPVGVSCNGTHDACWCVGRSPHISGVRRECPLCVCSKILIWNNHVWIFFLHQSKLFNFVFLWAFWSTLIIGEAEPGFVFFSVEKSDVWVSKVALILARFLWFCLFAQMPQDAHFPLSSETTRLSETGHKMILLSLSDMWESLVFTRWPF